MLSKEQILEWLNRVSGCAVEVFLPRSVTGRTDDEEVIQLDKEGILRNGFVAVDWFGTIQPIVPTVTFNFFTVEQEKKHRDLGEKMKKHFDGAIRVIYKKKQ